MTKHCSLLLCIEMRWTCASCNSVAAVYRMNIQGTGQGVGVFVTAILTFYILTQNVIIDFCKTVTEIYHNL
jgi:hypothetical protein